MSQDDFNFEPVRGLPERLPPGEHILWQGSPDPRALAREALSLRWVAAYFAVLAVWRFGVSMADYPPGASLGHAVPLILAGIVTCLILYLIATAQARATVYTITNKRVAMRIGAALTMTLNLPFVQIGGAQLDLRQGGTGTIAFSLLGETRISYLMTWPHVRPWAMARTQPALRCIPDAAAVARLFADAAETRVGLPQVTRAANDNSGGNAVPAE
jgi:hypothetical protein